MKVFVIAMATLLSSLPAVAAGRLGAGCKAGIERDLWQEGYAVNDMILMDKREGYCDGVTCNPDTLIIQVQAKTRSDRFVYLDIEAAGPSRGGEGCRVISYDIAKDVQWPRR